MTTESKRKFRETLRLNLNHPTVEMLDPNKIIIPDGDDEKIDSDWQRKGVRRQIKMLITILKEGFDIFAVLIARLPNGNLVAIDGGQRTRAAREAKCPKITCLVYKMDEDDAMRSFFALGETAPIPSSHKVHHWPGPAGEFIRETLPQVIKTRMSASQFVRGLASFLEGKSCMQIQKGLQHIDKRISLSGSSTRNRADEFVETMNRIFSGIDHQPPTMAVLSAALLLSEMGELPRRGKLAASRWRELTRILGSTQNTLPSWLTLMKKGW